MKICIVGAGGVGGYFGARLAAAGNDVIFVARGPHRQAMETSGLRIRSALGDLHVESPQLLSDAQTVGPCDAILDCTKMWDLAGTADLVRPLLGADTAVLPLQNGVSSEEILSEKLGAQHVLGSTAHIAARIAEPGVIEHNGSMARIAFGERDGRRSVRVERLQAALEAASIEHSLSENIDRDIWTKFIMLSPLAGATCFYRSPVGEVLAEPERNAKLSDLVAETRAVAEASGIDLSRLPLEKIMGRFGKLPVTMKTSMLHDLEAGRRLELTWLNGDVVRRGERLGVATPANVEVTEALKPHDLGASQ